VFRLVELDPSLTALIINPDTGFLVETDKNEPPNKKTILLDGIDISKVELEKVRQ
jgi:hypothetical protein